MNHIFLTLALVVHADDKPVGKHGTFADESIMVGKEKRVFRLVVPESVDLAKPAKDKPKVFTVPGLMKVTAMYKPPTPERRGIDPFTKEERTFKAKPASTKIKIRPLKSLKAMV